MILWFWLVLLCVAGLSAELPGEGRAAGQLVPLPAIHPLQQTGTEIFLRYLPKTFSDIYENTVYIRYLWKYSQKFTEIFFRYLRDTFWDFYKIIFQIFTEIFLRYFKKTVLFYNNSNPDSDKTLNLVFIVKEPLNNHKKC